MKKSADDEFFDAIASIVIKSIGMLLGALAGLLQRLFFMGLRKWRATHPREFHFPYEARFSHTMIIAGSGHGKTQMCQQLVINDIEEVIKGKRSIVVIDSQGDLINNISHLAQIPNDRLVLIDPHDIEHPPA